MFFPLPKYSFRTALVVFVILPICILIATASWIALASIERRAESRMQEDIELIARAIELPLSDALERDRPGSLQQTLDSAFQIDRVYGVYVYDDAGEIVAASGPYNPRVTSRSEARRVTETGSHGEFSERGGQETFSYFVPLSDTSGRISGLLQVTRHGNDFRSYFEQLRRLFLPLTIVAVMMLTAIVVFGHHRAIGRSLRSMEGAIARIRSGDRSHRVPDQDSREMHNLAGAMNSMLNAIDNSQRQVERSRADQELLERRLHQAEKMAAIGQLSAGVAHELGSPLNVIDGQAQRIVRRSPDDTDVERSAWQIRSEVRRLDHIVRQLMDVGRRNPLDRRRIRASTLVRNALARVREQLRSESTGIEVTCDDCDPEIHVDAQRLEQALVNLLTNAIQASPGGRVRITCFRNDESVGFLIDDDGPGIPESQRNQMYEPFFTTKHVGEGTGLGLSVAHGAVSDHDGQLVASDSPLGGMRFAIVLPRQEAPA